MHIDSIILDGFKSYSTRTVIGPLDPHFNAVTGLNGSGKSNVLDSLCFVFGISDLSRVRVNKLDELIYKMGQAGITRASVTVIFNNTNPNSPLPDPYRKMPEVTVTRQIAIGGRSRYFLNNHPVTPKVISDFFQAARMNVNNARFLIMQGCITKVVNMTPKELLSLIEEASGTRIYESKRCAAVKLMERKDQKLNEIRKILSDEIEPSMNKLKNDYDDYIKWINIRDELDNLIKYNIAYRYWSIKEKMKIDLQELNELISTRGKLTEENSTIDEKLKEISTQYEEKMKEVEEVEEEVVEVKNLMTCMENDFKKLKLNKNLMEIELNELKSNHQSIEKELNENKIKLNEMNKLNLNKLEIELKLNENKNKLDELINENNKIYNKQLKLKLYKTNLSNLEANELSNLKIINFTRDEINKNEKLLMEIGNLNDELKIINENLQEINKKLNEFNDVNIKLKKLKLNYNNLYNESIHLNNFINKLRINYNIPHNINTLCYGQVFDLLSLNDDGNMEYIPSIHVIIGYKLNYIVVQDKKSAKILFHHNNFNKSNRKVTILPLEDIVINNPITSTDIQYCRKFCGVDENDNNNITYYLDLIKFNPEFMGLAQYIMGNVVFCSKSEYARKIAYDMKKYTAITLEGDKYDRNGSMSGGSNRGVNLILEKIYKLNELKFKLKEVQDEIDGIQSSLYEYNTLINGRKTLKGRETSLNGRRISLDGRRISLNGREISSNEKMTSSNEKKTSSIINSHDIDSIIHTLLHEKKTSLNERKISLNTIINSYNLDSINNKLINHKKILNEKNIEMGQVGQQKDELKLEIAALEEEIEDYIKNREKNEEIIKDRIKELKNEIKTDGNKLDEITNNTKLQEDYLIHQIEALSDECINVKKSIEELMGKMGSIDEEMKMKEVGLERCEEKYNVKMKMLKELKEGVDCIKKKECQLDEEKNGVLIKIKKLEYNIEERNNVISSSKSLINELIKENEWIIIQEENFNKKNTKYDFTNIRIDVINKKLNELENIKYNLSRKINNKAKLLYNKVLDDYNDLIIKYNKVLNDKNNIKKFITNLDELKNENINLIFNKINKYFSDIFNILLPNSNAKLDLINNIGINIKISFNNIWKNNLSELSGGQKSLLALSLILAMLKVKPAPIYILDEIDAALDLSHTQNISKMIKTQFPKSQFIIVSLKDGMFTNANVLFKTRFVDGSSIITRHTISYKKNENSEDRRKHD